MVTWTVRSQLKNEACVKSMLRLKKDVRERRHSSPLCTPDAMNPLIQTIVHNVPSDGSI